MKELNHFVQRKGFIASVKGYLFFTRAPRQSRGAGGGRNPVNPKLFLKSLY